jgi:dimethylhistidine N-methyltransferase
VAYQPVDVSETALAAACERIAVELPEVATTPIVADYTDGWGFPPDRDTEERQLLLWIGSSIGNFEPEAAVELLARVNDSMLSGDGLLLGVDLAPSPGGKSEGELIDAYDDAARVTAAFNSNLLVRLNRELGAEFNPDSFAHRAIWNSEKSRMEMHLESLHAQRVWIDALGMDVEFVAGERLHTENSYKYTAKAAEQLMARAGFPVVRRWSDGNGWFAVMLGQKG